ncbi:MAG: hypothetical protein IJM19_02675, partial [Ruminococcus sp.]|nr:hypothetical protein [Ruminococcus sp.]
LYPLNIIDSEAGSDKIFEVQMAYGTHLAEFIPDLSSKNCEFICWTSTFDDSNRYMGTNAVSLNARLREFTNSIKVSYSIPLYEDGKFVDWKGSGSAYDLTFSVSSGDMLSFSEIFSRLSKYELTQNIYGHYILKDAIIVLPDGTCVPCVADFNSLESEDGENIIVDGNMNISIVGKKEKADYASYKLEYLFEDENGDYRNDVFDDEKEEYDRTMRPVFKYGEEVTADAVNYYSDPERAELLRASGYEFEYVEFDGKEVEGDVICTASEEHKNTSIKVYFKKTSTIKVAFKYPEESVTRTFKTEDIINTPSLEDLENIPEGSFAGWTWEEVKNSKGEVLLKAQTEPTDDLSALENALGSLVDNRVRKVILTGVWVK